MAIEIEIQSPYGTKIGSGPITTGRNWRSQPRMNKIGAFSFEMPLNDPRRSYLVQKRYVRCYGMVNDTRTELGKPGIIDSIVKVLDANGIPTGMLKVSGRDLFAELADINIHELSLIDTVTRTPESVQYYDGTTTAYLDMSSTRDGNNETGTHVPADDEDWIYVGDSAPFDVVGWHLGTYRNVDPGTFKVQYSQGSSNWGSGTLLSDTTKANETDDPGQPGNWGASWWKVDGQMRWERSEDWAVDTVNGVSGKYWLRFQYSEDMSSDHPTEDDVDINEISIIQDIPTATALADWLAYTDAASETPISGLGWSFEATHTATENTVFLILRDVSAFEALTLIGEQTGENFRLGAGREIEWLQDDKVASGIRATNIPSGIAARDNAAICLITQLQETEDSYEVGSRVYPKGGGRGVMRITLAQCTDSAPAGYTLNKAANYLKKDSVEEAAPTGYGRRIEMTKFWPTVVSPSWASSRDTNSSNALLKLAYEHLSRHWEPQKSYQFSVVKLDTEIKVGETIQLHYWQAVDGVAVWDLGVSTALHLWVLEITHAVDDAGARIVAMQVATIDAWPASDASKVTSLVSQVKSLQSTDGPISAENLTLQTIVNQFTGATSHGQLTGVTADQHHGALINLDGDSGTAVPDASDSIIIAGGAGLVTSAATNTVTIAVGAGTLITVNANDVALSVGGAQYQVPVTGASPFTPAWTALSTYAGAGLAWSTNAYAVGAGNGIAVAADSIAVDLVAAWSGLEFSGADLRVDLDADFTWTGTHDFASIWADELHVKAFIADIYSALAGGLIITKSRARVSRDFTIPNTNATATLYVEDLEGQAEAAVFVSGDYVRLNVIDTSGGGLLVISVYGTVTSYANLAGGEQSWTFTTTTTGYSGADVIYRGSIVLDYGQTGSGSRGIWEATVLAAGAPFSRVQSWSAIVGGNPATFTTHFRAGNLKGIAEIGSDIYGLFAGDYADGDYLLYQAGGDPDFLIKAGAGAVSIDDTGIRVGTSSTASFALPYAYAITHNTTIVGGIFGYWETSPVDDNQVIYLSAEAIAGRKSYTIVRSVSPAGLWSSVELAVYQGETTPARLLLSSTGYSDFYYGDVRIAQGLVVGNITSNPGNGELIVTGGLNVGTATGAGTGDGLFSGKVGINFAAPGERLVVADNVAGFVSGFFNDGNNANRSGVYIVCGTDAGGGGATAVLFQDGDFGACGYIHIAANQVTLDNPSDERLKRDIVDTASVMDRLRAVQVRDFTMKRSGGRLTGFVAQELMQPFPELVGYDEISGMYYNRPALMTPILVKAVQEVDAEVMAIKVEIAKLQEQLDKMERRG